MKTKSKANSSPHIFLILIALASALSILTGCKKDNVAGYQKGLTESAADLTNGLNVLYFDAGSPYPSVKLYAEEPVYLTAVGNVNGVTNSITREGDVQYLNLYPPASTGGKNLNYPFLCQFELSVKSDETLNKTLYIIFRDHRQIGGGQSPESDPFSAIGRGMLVTGDFGAKNQLARLLDYGNMFHNDSLTTDDLMTSEYPRQGLSNEVSGSRYQSTVGGLGSMLGVEGFKDLKTTAGTPYAFASSLDLVLGASKTETDNYEYYINYYTKTMIRLSLKSTVTGSVTGLLNFIDSTANSVLNNPCDAGYKAYANDQASIFKLLDTYGTHLMTQGSFGGRHMYVYGREENDYGYSVDVSAAANLDKIFSPAVAARYPYDADAGKLIAAIGGQLPDPETEQATVAISGIAAIGGNASASDFELWNTSINVTDIQNYALIGYEGADKRNGGLIKISGLVVDPARKQAIEENLDAYIESKITVKKN